LYTLPLITPEFVCPVDSATAITDNSIIDKKLFIKSVICTRNSESRQIVQKRSFNAFSISGYSNL